MKTTFKKINDDTRFILSHNKPDFMLIWDKRKIVDDYRLFIVWKDHSILLFKRYGFIWHVKNSIHNLIFTDFQDNDCDGTSFSRVDKLTGGKIYSLRSWHFMDYLSYSDCIHNSGMVKKIFGKIIFTTEDQRIQESDND